MFLYHSRILDIKFYRKCKPQRNEAPQVIELVDDPMVEPLPSEKQCTRAVLGEVEGGGDKET